MSATITAGSAGIRPQHVQRINYDLGLDDPLGGLTVRGLGGDDVFASDDNSARTTLDGGIGDDTFQFGQLYGTQRNSAAAPAGGDLATGDIFGTIATTRGWLSAGVSRATAAVGGEGDDVFAVYANEALLTLLGGAGDARERAEGADV